MTYSSRYSFLACNSRYAFYSLIRRVPRTRYWLRSSAFMFIVVRIERMWIKKSWKRDKQKKRKFSINEKERERAQSCTHSGKEKQLQKAFFSNFENFAFFGFPSLSLPFSLLSHEYRRKHSAHVPHINNVRNISSCTDKICLM